MIIVLVQVSEYVDPGGVIVKLAGLGVAPIVKLVVIEQPFAVITVTFVTPAPRLLAVVCVGDKIPGGTGLQITE